MPVPIDPLAFLAALALLAWGVLLGFRGGFWRADRRLAPTPAPPHWPAVTAVVPARNEEAVIAEAVASLAAQAYPGRFEIVVVDDASTDATAARARAAGAERVVAAGPRPAGWVGKTWALARGVAAAGDAPEFLWFSDADVVHPPDVVARLVAKAEAEARVLVSLMVLLECRTAWERLLVPAFVFFFQKLYPFRWVNDARRRTAAAAGGCALVRRRALAAAGSIAAIREAVIDDCALARVLKREGSIWLGLTEGSHSARAYLGLAGVWRMVARSAYAQLGYSPILLAGTVAGMGLLYLVPPLALAAGLAQGAAATAVLGAVGWAAMAVAYAPTVRLYRQSPALAASLPLAAALYTAMTLASARRGAAWKGRTYAGPRR